MSEQTFEFRALSLFSSAGVAETYFEKHGIHVRVASELLHERAVFYRHLYPNTTMIEGDITDNKTFSNVISAAEKEQCNFIIATPPCQGMSTAGLQKKDDPRNRLIIEVVKAIHIIKPEFVIIENVPEILQTRIEIDGEWILIDDYLHSELDGEYSFNKNKIVNAMYYGVAQSRERCVYLLTSKKYDWIWEFPKPSTHITTMRDAIGDLPSLDPDVTDITDEERAKLFPEYETKRAAGLAISKWHYPPKHKYRHVIAMMHTPEGCSAWNNKKYYPTHVFPLFSSHKSVYGQGQIPDSNCQLPDQNYAADQTAKDKVECNNTYCPGNTKANRDKREHLSDAERHSASKPNQEIIRRSVLNEYAAENRKQQECNSDRNHGLLHEVFHNFASCHTPPLYFKKSLR